MFDDLRFLEVHLVSVVSDGQQVVDTGKVGADFEGHSATQFLIERQTEDPGPDRCVDLLFYPGVSDLVVVLHFANLQFYICWKRHFLQFFNQILLFRFAELPAETARHFVAHNEI